jgi:hypothetical protein
MKTLYLLFYLWFRCIDQYKLYVCSLKSYSMWSLLILTVMSWFEITNSNVIIFSGSRGRDHMLVRVTSIYITGVDLLGVISMMLRFLMWSLLILTVMSWFVANIVHTLSINTNIPYVKLFEIVVRHSSHFLIAIE